MPELPNQMRLYKTEVTFADEKTTNKILKAIGKAKQI